MSSTLKDLLDNQQEEETTEQPAQNQPQDEETAEVDASKCVECNDHPYSFYCESCLDSKQI